MSLTKKYFLDSEMKRQKLLYTNILMTIIWLVHMQNKTVRTESLGHKIRFGIIIRHMSAEKYNIIESNGNKFVSYVFTNISLKFSRQFLRLNYRV